MDFNTVNTFQRLGVPSNVIHTILIILIVLLFAPYVGGLDFKIFVVPDFPPRIENLLKWIAPILFLVYLIMFTPLWKAESAQVESSKKERPNSVHSKSKYRLQSTPDIILNELHMQNVNTGGIKIVPGINIHDLKKRVKILNQQLADEKINHLVESARETAFSSKYAAPKEDEKLVSINEFHVQGIKEWHIYLKQFLSKLGISDIKNIDVLDVGIGNAYASQVFLDNCANLTGVDISQDALNYARTNGDTQISD